MTYESYNAYLFVTKSTPKESYKQSFQDIVAVDFEDASTIKTIKHNKRNIKARIVRVFSKESLNRRIDSLKKIIFKDNDYIVNTGDIFEFDGNKWLCIDTGKTLYSRSCTVGKCNDTLKIYNNGEIEESSYFVLDNIALTRMGIDQNRYITIPQSKMLIVVADNEINRNISRNDVYKLKGLDDYRVIDINRIRFNGLIILELDFSISEQQIPNESNESEEIITGYKIIGDSDIYIGQSKFYQAIKYIDGEIIQDAKFEFSIHGDILANKYSLSIIDEQNCKIEAKGYTYVIILRATDINNEENEKYVEKEIKLRGLF